MTRGVKGDGVNSRRGGETWSAVRGGVRGQGVGVCEGGFCVGGSDVRSG